MMMIASKFFLLLFLFGFAWIPFANSSDSASEPDGLLEPIKISGRFSMWTSKICLDQTELCELPKPLGQSWVETFSYLRPTEIGKSKVVDETFISIEVIIHFSQYWVQRPPPEVSYLITQITLARKDQGPIAVCSRYDSVDVFSFLPPGACSGRDGDQLLGISISKP